MATMTYETTKAAYEAARATLHERLPSLVAAHVAARVLTAGRVLACTKAASAVGAAAIPVRKAQTAMVAAAQAALDAGTLPESEIAYVEREGAVSYQTDDLLPDDE